MSRVLDFEFVHQHLVGEDNVDGQRDELSVGRKITPRAFAVEFQRRPKRTL